MPLPFIKPDYDPGSFPYLDDGSQPVSRAAWMAVGVVVGCCCEEGTLNRYRTLTHSLTHWLPPAQIFHESIEYFRGMAAADDSVPDASAKADAFADAYAAAIASPEHYSCLHLCKLREDALRDAGFRDIFRVVKATENANALKLLKSVLEELDALDAPSSWPVVISNILAGNIFDCGTAATRNDSFCFQTSRTYLKSRPWVIDDLDAFVRAMTSKTYGLPARPSRARSLSHTHTRASSVRQVPPCPSFLRQQRPGLLPGHAAICPTAAPTRRGGRSRYCCQLGAQSQRHDV